MTILILYATTEGQTRKIARRAAAHLTAAGRSVELLPVAEAAETDLSRFDRVLLMGSIHAGRYQPALMEYVAAARVGLALLPTAFFSVSLSAASDDPKDHAEIEACYRRMTEETGWTPGRVLHVAGAFRFPEYDFFKAWAMRWIASRKDPGIDTDGVTEYTNWQEIYDFLDDWTAAAD